MTLSLSPIAASLAARGRSAPLASLSARRFLALDALLVSMCATMGAPREAEAFCGFYVSGADGKLFNDATQVVMMREGTRTVLSMQNDYKGPPQDFALVIPVPVVLQKENVKTLSNDVFTRVDKLSAPRLVEYWEQDPCPAPGLGNIGTIGHGAGTGTGQGFGSGHGRLGGAHQVKIEAQFEVGEYEILILSAQDSSGLDGWLREHGYKIPENAEPALKPYVAAGSKFFVAKVNVAKVKFDTGGRASLSPLRFHYDAEKFELPVKLGLLNSGGVQDLIVHVIAPERYEVANYPNAFIPTNLDVSEAARESFGAFYASLFDRTLEKQKGAVVTEYAWGATSCDPCPSGIQGMTGNDLASLGADVIPGWNVSAGSPSASIRLGATAVSGGLPPEVIQRIVRQNFGRFRLCYENGLRTNPNLQGKVVVKFDIDASGAATSVTDSGSDLPDQNVIGCITKAFSGLSFPEPENKKRVSVTYPILFAPGPGGGSTVNVTGMRGSLVLTRLHARYGKESLGSDLVFRKADGVLGGREQWNDGKLEQGATKSSVSSFQGRYAIRHPWQGPITCKEPQRGMWGGPWPDAGASEQGVRSATKLAYAPRGNVTLASFTDVKATTLDNTTAAPSSSNMPADAADAGPVAKAGAAPAPMPSSRCGCRVVASSTGAPSALLALALATLLVARRRR